MLTWDGAAFPLAHGSASRGPCHLDFNKKYTTLRLTRTIGGKITTKPDIQHKFQSIWECLKDSNVGEIGVCSKGFEVPYLD